MSMCLLFKKICDDFGLTPFGVRHALEQYQIIITELTDGFFSKLTYDAPVILDRVKECFENKHSEMEPVRHGRWVPVKAGSSSYPFWNNQCSACGWMTGVANAGSYKYCPECGAKMDGGENDD